MDSPVIINGQRIFGCPKCGLPECSCSKIQVYLAARYSRRLELCVYRSALEQMGFMVQARWLNGGHQLDAVGTPIGDSGEALVEAGGEEAARLCARFASDDLEDVVMADLLIAFTEEPRSTATRGGRHVEFGIALAQGKRTLIVGPRENIFYWLDTVEQVRTWSEALPILQRTIDGFKALGGAS